MDSPRSPVSAKPMKQDLHRDTNKKRRLSGAAKRRLKKMIWQGKDYETARLLCNKPLFKGASTIKRERLQKEAPYKKENKTKLPSYENSLHSIKVAVCGESLLTKSQLKDIQAAIIEEVDKSPKGGLMPRFLDCSGKSGWLSITCADEQSRIWLITAVERLKLWPNCRLRVCEGEFMPKQRIGTVWIPGEDKPAPKKILSRLLKQNKGLRTDEWKVINRELGENGQTLTLSIDEISCKVLQELDYRPYLHYGRVHIRMTDQPKEAVKSNTRHSMEAGPSHTVKKPQVPWRKQPCETEVKPSHIDAHAQRSGPNINYGEKHHIADNGFSGVNTSYSTAHSPRFSPYGVKEYMVDDVEFRRGLETPNWKQVNVEERLIQNDIPKPWELCGYPKVPTFSRSEWNSNIFG